MLLGFLSALSILGVSQKGVPEPSRLALETIDLSSISQGWGTPGRGKSVDGNPLRIGGQTYTKGIGSHAAFEWDLNLNRRGIAFEAVVGVDDEVGRRGSVKFLVLVDGKVRAETRLLRGGDPAVPIRVSLKGARSLSLVVTDGGDGIDYDHADWANAVLTMEAGSRLGFVPLAKDPPLEIAPVDLDRTEFHGPRVIGGTPGNPFLFRVPVTGRAPVKVRYEGLPDGVRLVPGKGDVILSGTVPPEGKYRFRAIAEGPGGRDEREYVLESGPRKVARTPPMGWNSWNVWGTSVDANKVRAAADGFLASRLADFGYAYVNIDDAWEAGRDANGEIQTNSKFPDMASLSQYVHAQGLKLGIYSSPGPKTCANYEGSYLHEFKDAETYAKWGVDYLKYDWCSYGGIAKNGSDFELRKPYRLMRAALDSVPRDIVYSLCQYGMGQVWTWGGAVGGNVWRTTGDITDTWDSMANIGFAHKTWGTQVRPGEWNDPDMLVVGRLGWSDNPRPTRLTPHEQATHIALWSLLAAPLIIGCDLTKIDDLTARLLMNHEVIEIDQDPLGEAAKPVKVVGTSEVWARRLHDGIVAVGLFNRGPRATKISIDWASLGLRGPAKVRNVWTRKDVGIFDREFSATVPRHGVVFVKIGG